MKFLIDHDLHIHTWLSRCSGNPEQNSARILQYAKENNYRTVALTNHYWDAAVPGITPWFSGQDFAHLCKDKPLPSDPNVRFLFGCEADLRKDGTLTIPAARYDDFDFIVIAITHFSSVLVGLPENAPARVCAKVWAERLEALLDLNLPWHKVGIAHLASPYIATDDRPLYLETLDTIPADVMARLFSKAARLGCGIELNRHDMHYAANEAYSVLRMFRIARNCGCRFYCASDAHQPTDLDMAPAILQKAVDVLGLQESDKFILPPA
jgi:histidinol phosphatase-like PHP family hydrolase